MKAAEEGEIIVRAKWTIDGSQNLHQAADKSRKFAEYLDDLEDKGYQFYQPVEDDYGFVTLGGEVPEEDLFEEE